MLSMTMHEYGDATVLVKLPKLRNEDAVEGESESNSRTRMFIAALPFATTESPMSVGGELSAGRLLEKLLHTHKLSHRLKVGELRKSLLQTKLKEDMSQRFSKEMSSGVAQATPVMGGWSRRLGAAWPPRSPSVGEPRRWRRREGSSSAFPGGTKILQPNTRGCARGPPYMTAPCNSTCADSKASWLL